MAMQWASYLSTRLRSRQTKAVKIGVESKTSDVVRGMSSGEARELGSRVGDDGGDSDKRGVQSIRVGR